MTLKRPARNVATAPKGPACAPPNCSSIQGVPFSLPLVVDVVEVEAGVVVVVVVVVLMAARVGVDVEMLDTRGLCWAASAMFSRKYFAEPLVHRCLTPLSANTVDVKFPDC